MRVKYHNVMRDSPDFHSNGVGSYQIDLAKEVFYCVECQWMGASPQIKPHLLLEWIEVCPFCSSPDVENLTQMTYAETEERFLPQPPFSVP